MNVLSMARRVLDTAGKFRRDDGGNIVVIFAIALVPLLGFVGAALDYSRAVAARTRMQSALDATALMAAKDAPNLSASALTTRATGYFNALFTTPVGNPTFNFTYTPASGGTAANVKVSASGAIQTDFLKMVGHPALTISSSATTTWANTRLRVALALDVTGSMKDDGKMTAMKAAATKLVDTLSSSAASNGDVYLSVVPFAKDVNVGKSNYNQGWLDWTDWSKDSANKTCDWRGNNCTVKAKSTWNGCVTDRTESYDTTGTPPTNYATDFPAEQYDDCPAQLLPLTYDFAAVKTKIDNLQPAGGTNQPIGLFWAWWTLRSNAPFAAPATDPNFTYITAIILFTDGLNTQQRNPAYGNGQKQYDGKIDARQKILCDNVKTDSVRLYTIQVNTDGDMQSTVLPYCAGTQAATPDLQKFFMLTSATQIMSAFDEISADLKKLRVSK
jgi:Flp pilus assembly protein TadG